MTRQNFLNSKAFVFIKYIGIFLTFFILANAGINGEMYPFVMGAFFAFMWCNQNVFIMLPLYILANYLISFSVYLLVANLIMSVVFVLIYFIHYKLKKPFKPLHILIYSCICSLPKLMVGVFILNSNIYLCFVELFVSLLFTFACIKFFECISVRGITGRLTNLETICAMSFVGAFSCGIMFFTFGDFYLIKLIGVIVALVLGYVGNVSSLLLTMLAIAIGTLINGGNASLFCVLVLYGTVASIFKTSNKFISVVALIGIECLCGFYFNFYLNYTVISFLPVLIGSFLYIICPVKYLNNFSNEFLSNLCSISHQSVINRNRQMLYTRLIELSDVFAEMNKIFRGMIRGGLVSADAKRLLIAEVKNKNCKDCSNYGKCYRVFNAETTNALNLMVNACFEKGKVNLLDVPTIFAGKCERLNSVVGGFNDLISQYKNYEGLVNSIDSGKVLLAEQLGGVSQIMKDLSKEVNGQVNFEKGKEKRIIDELTYNNIVCLEALVFRENDNVMSVTLSVRESDLNEKIISRVVGKACGHKMEVANCSASNKSGFNVVTLKSAPKYDVVFGVASKTKTGSVKCGDCYSVLKIKDGKYLFAICDGMGSGAVAEDISSTALGLLENFYKAGFDKDIILSSINKLLSLSGEDVFSALDICVVDTVCGTGDFIKMGAPESYIKHKDTTDNIQIGALPLGIMQNAEPKSKTVCVTSGDKIILCSDGVVDSFFGEQNLKDYINNMVGTTPQIIADKIIKTALEKNNNIAKDDMTILVVKIFEK